MSAAHALQLAPAPVVDEARELAPFVDEVMAAWEAIPEAFFTPCSRRDALASFAAEGALELLVDARRDRDPLPGVLSRLCVSAAPAHRPILARWVVALARRADA